MGKDKVRGRLFSAVALQLGNLEGPRGERFAVRLLSAPADRVVDGCYDLQQPACLTTAATQEEHATGFNVVCAAASAGVAKL